MIEHNVMSHIMRLTSMAEELRNLESPLTDQQLIMKILHSLPTSYRAFQSAWLSVPVREQTIQNLTTRLIGEEALTRNINKGEMDPADVAFFAGQTPPATDVAFHAPRGRGGGYPSFRRGSRGFRGRGGGSRGNRTDGNSNRNRAETTSTIVCFSCDQTGHKSYNCPNKRAEERKQQRDEKFNKSRTSFGCVSSSLCIVARQPDFWYADSTASSHMTDKRAFFTTFKEIPPGVWKVNGIGGVQLEARGIGNVNVTAFIEGEETKGTFQDVLFVPNLSVNLFSVGSATEAGLEVHFKGTKASFSMNDTTVMTGERIGDSLYLLSVLADNCKHREDFTAKAVSLASAHLLHQRFAHANCRDVIRTIKSKAVEDIKLDPGQDNTAKPCNGCVYGKMHRLPFPTKRRERAEKVGELVQGDVGMVNVTTPDGCRFYSLLKDDFTEFTNAKLLRKKSDAATHVIEFCEKIKTQTGNPVKVLRTDQGTEYRGERFDKWKQDSGIIHQLTCRYTPQQNGVSERANRTVVEGVKSSLYNGSDDRKSPNTGSNVQELWGEFLCATVYIRNRILTAKTNTTPYEKFFGKKPAVDHLRVLGCQAKVFTPSELRLKLDPTSEIGWLVGYCENTTGWRVWNPKTRKIVISRDVIFDETIFIGDAVTKTASEVKHNPCEPFRVLMEALEANQREEHAVNADQGEQEQNEDVEIVELMDEGNSTVLYNFYE